MTFDPLVGLIVGFAIVIGGSVLLAWAVSSRKELKEYLWGMLAVGAVVVWIIIVGIGLPMWLAHAVVLVVGGFGLYKMVVTGWRHEEEQAPKKERDN